MIIALDIIWLMGQVAEVSNDSVVDLANVMSAPK